MVKALLLSDRRRCGNRAIRAGAVRRLVLFVLRLGLSAAGGTHHGSRLFKTTCMSLMLASLLRILPARIGQNLLINFGPTST